jgi:hypothetical protein
MHARDQRVGRHDEARAVRRPQQGGIVAQAPRALEPGGERA